jgi:hypothetical protein
VKTLSVPWSAGPTEAEPRSILAWFAIAGQLALFFLRLDGLVSKE